MLVNAGLASSSLIETARVAGDLQPSRINPSWVIEGSPQAQARALSQSIDGQVWTVVWECTQGCFNWHYSYDETILILEGSVVLESESLPATRYVPGDVILFRKGAHARWRVENYVKKLAVCHKTLPPFVSLPIQILRSLKRKLVPQVGALEGLNAL